MAMAVMVVPMMAMVVAMVMPVATVMAVMAMAAVMAVTSTVPAVTAASERLTRDGQRNCGQRQSRDSGRNELPDLGHRRLLVVQREDRSTMIQPRKTGCVTM